MTKAKIEVSWQSPIANQISNGHCISQISLRMQRRYTRCFAVVVVWALALTACKTAHEESELEFSASEAQSRIDALEQHSNIFMFFKGHKEIKASTDYSQNYKKDMTHSFRLEFAGIFSSRRHTEDEVLWNETFEVENHRGISLAMQLPVSTIIDFIRRKRNEAIKHGDVTNDEIKFIFRLIQRTPGSSEQSHDITEVYLMTSTPQYRHKDVNFRRTSFSDVIAYGGSFFESGANFIRGFVGGKHNPHSNRTELTYQINFGNQMFYTFADELSEATKKRDEYMMRHFKRNW